MDDLAEILDLFGEERAAKVDKDLIKSYPLSIAHAEVSNLQLLVPFLDRTLDF